jgi:cytochrome c553
MKSRTTLVIGTLSLVAAFALWEGTQLPAASADMGVFTAASNIPAALLAADAEFVGAGKCKKCHLAEHKSWEKTPHATALDALKPGNATEAKTKAKLDPAKDYSKDAACVACHTVGFGKPGGYQMPADEEAAKKMKNLEGVGCENCHGAGGTYIAVHEEIMKSKRKYKIDEMKAAGTVTPDKAVCLGCHNDKSPTFDASKPFDFDAMKAKGVHEIAPLKQKE